MKIIIMITMLLLNIACTGNNPIPTAPNENDAAQTSDENGSSSGISLNSNKEITDYRLTWINNLKAQIATGIINQTNKTISVTVPFGTNVKELVAFFTTTGRSVKVSGIEQKSGVTPNNFINSVVYTVTASNSTTQNYIVIVTIAAKITKEITSYNIVYYDGIRHQKLPGLINQTNYTISVAVPNIAKLKSLVAIFTTTGASVKIGTVEQVSGETSNDFTNPLIYKVIASDHTTQNYTVTVRRLALVETLVIAGTPLTSQLNGLEGKGGGIIKDQGGAVITQRGVCWSRTQNPTINNSVATNSGTNPEFNVSMTGLTVNTNYYVRAYAITDVGVAYGNEVKFNSGKTYGTEYAGGYVFYNDGNGGGLVAAKIDLAESPWISGGNTQTTLNSGTSKEFKTGLSNSLAIVAQNGHVTSAAKLCLDYSDGTYSDWYLPSFVELNNMWFRLHLRGIGNFISLLYVSSSEEDATKVWAVMFHQGGYGFAAKNLVCRVRAIRNF